MKRDNVFLSLRVFGLLSSSLLLFPQRFGRYVLRLSSGVGRTHEPTRNSELRPLLNPRELPVLSHNRVQVLSIPAGHKVTVIGIGSLSF